MELSTCCITGISTFCAGQRNSETILLSRCQRMNSTGTANRKSVFFSYDKRKQLLESIRYVDLVIPENDWDQKIEDVKLYKVDTFVMGDDWEGKFDFLKDYCEVVYLPRTPEISTTQIKKELGK